MPADCQCGARASSYAKLKHNPGCPVEALRERLRPTKEQVEAAGRKFGERMARQGRALKRQREEIDARRRREGSDATEAP